MPIIAENKPSKTFELAKEGTVQAVLAEVRDLGMLPQTYKGVTKSVHKVLFRWQLAENDAEGQPKRIYERFTNSLHTEANLRKRIFGMFGKEPPMKMDLEKLVGTNVNLVIIHAPSKKDPTKTFANIAAILRLTPNTPKLEIIAIPQKEEKVLAGAGTDARNETSDQIGDEDIPF